MAKPSITNIRPPKTPPKTEWVLDDDFNDPFYANHWTDASHTVATDSYLALRAQVDTSRVATALLDAGFEPSNEEAVGNLIESFDYIFLGVNGGNDETVTGREELGGFIATGDGKDHVTGGNVGDLILTGNGSDTANGGDGDDYIFGENGADKLNGDAGNDWLFGGNGPDTLAGGTDDGTFSAGGGTVIEVNDGVTVFDTDPSGTNTTGTGNDVNQVLKKEGVFVDGDNAYLVWSFEPADPPPAGGDLKVTVAVYNGAFEVIQTFEATFEENKVNYFKTALEGSGHVAVFEGHGLTIPDGNPHSDALKEQGFDADEFITVTDGGGFQFEAGDHLTGSEGPDTFVYHSGDGVDEVTDYSRSDGDVLRLDAVLQGDVDILHENGDSYVVFKDGNGGFIQDAAIKVSGIADLEVSELQFA